MDMQSGGLPFFMEGVRHKVVERERDLLVGAYHLPVKVSLPLYHLVPHAPTSKSLSPSL